MFNSKAFCVIIFLTALALAVAVGLQFMEMQQYNLIETLQERYFSSSEEPAESTAAKENAPAEKQGEKTAEQGEKSSEEKKDENK